MKQLRILFHVAVGNKDRPERWRAVGEFYSQLATSLELLGHECYLTIHKKAVPSNLFHRSLVTNKVRKLESINFKPDYVFTWNGISPGDQEVRRLFSQSKFVFGELGFFDHYNTCYFDFSGTNFASMNMVEPVDKVEFQKEAYEALLNKNIRERIFTERYIFLPLQDENDTQIKTLSIFKTMDSFIRYVLGLYAYDDTVRILYKQHPHTRSLVPQDSKLIEVTDNVHHYLPYAENVIGINSTVLFETLLYHQRILATGLGIPSRKFSSELERKKFVMNCLQKQIRLKELGNPEIISKSWFYNEMIKNQ